MKAAVFIGLGFLGAATAAAGTLTTPNTEPGGDNATPGGGNPALGSVISSFYFSGTTAPYALGCCRDATYVYGVFYGSPCSLRSYTPNGSFIGSVTLAGFSGVRGGSACHLGASYFALLSGSSLRFVYVPTGSTVQSFNVGGTPMDVGFNGTYYFLAGSSGSFQVYTTAGASAGSWGNFSSIGGFDWNLYVNGANNGGTGYMVVFTWTSGGTNWAASYPQGSVVGSWSHAGANANGAMCGPSSNPPTMGTVAWANIYTGGAMYCYQVDLGNPPTAVVPTSIGHVKALYR